MVWFLVIWLGANQSVSMVSVGSFSSRDLCQAAGKNWLSNGPRYTSDTGPRMPQGFVCFSGVR